MGATPGGCPPTQCPPESRLKGQEGRHLVPGDTLLGGPLLPFFQVEPPLPSLRLAPQNLGGGQGCHPTQGSATGNLIVFIYQTVGRKLAQPLCLLSSLS